TYALSPHAMIRSATNNRPTTRHIRRAPPDTAWTCSSCPDPLRIVGNLKMTTQNSVQPPRVLIADDHPLYCDALRAVVPQAYPGADISEANSQEQVLSTVAAGSETGAREPPLTAIRLSAFRAAP